MASFVVARVGGRMQGTEELFLSNQASITICQMTECTLRWLKCLLEIGLTPLEFWSDLISSNKDI